MKQVLHRDHFCLSGVAVVIGADSITPHPSDAEKRHGSIAADGFPAGSSQQLAEAACLPSEHRSSSDSLFLSAAVS